MRKDYDFSDGIRGLHTLSHIRFDRYSNGNWHSERVTCTICDATRSLNRTGSRKWRDRKKFLEEHRECKG